MYRPTETLTVQNAQTALNDGLRAIADGQTYFDLAGLTLVDSAAVATMLAWQRAARSKGKSLLLINIPPNLQSLIDLYGVTGLLHSANTAETRADLPHH
ncbi:MAG TPA: STAS domain-containing protein [Noviherbaspirillum sp.]